MHFLFCVILISALVHPHYSAMFTKTKEEQIQKTLREVDMDFEGYDRNKVLLQRISSYRADHAKEYSQFRQKLKKQQKQAKRLGLESIVNKESKLKSWPIHCPRTAKKNPNLRKIRNLY